MLEVEGVGHVNHRASLRLGEDPVANLVLDTLLDALVLQTRGLDLGHEDATRGADLEVNLDLASERAVSLERTLVASANLVTMTAHDAGDLVA